MCSEFTRSALLLCGAQPSYLLSRSFADLNSGDRFWSNNSIFAPIWTKIRKLQASISNISKHSMTGSGLC